MFSSNLSIRFHRSAVVRKCANDPFDWSFEGQSIKKEIFELQSGQKWWIAIEIESDAVWFSFIIMYHLTKHQNPLAFMCFHYIVLNQRMKQITSLCLLRFVCRVRQEIFTKYMNELRWSNFFSHFIDAHNILRILSFWVMSLPWLKSGGLLQLVHFVHNSPIELITS